MKRAMSIGAMAVICIASLVTAGCSSDNNGDNPSASAKSTAASTSHKGSPNGAPALKAGAAGIVKDVKRGECSTKTGDVTAKGSVTNTSKEKKDIVITVSWTDPKTSQVKGSGYQVFKAVDPGKTENYEIKAKASAPQDMTLSCVVGATAGTLE